MSSLVLKRTQVFNGPQTEHESIVSHNYHKEKYILECTEWVDVREVGDMLLDSFQHHFELCQEEFTTAHEGCDPDERGSPKNNDLLLDL